MREGIRSYLYSLYISGRTGNMDGFRPRILSYHHNIIKLAEGARLIVEDRAHLSTRRNTWPSSCYIELGKNSTLHFTGRASIRGEARIQLADGAKLVIGDQCVLRERLWIVAHKEIIIGDGTSISHETMIIDSDAHPVISDGVEQPIQKPVHIGKNVWIGARSTILKGVTIGDESIIGAGSLVTKDIPDHVLAFGRPARPQRKVDYGNVRKEIYQAGKNK